MNNDNILIIVPPKPEYGLEFSYSNLYSSPSSFDFPHHCYNDGGSNNDHSYRDTAAVAAPAVPPARANDGSRDVVNECLAVGTASAMNSSPSARSTLTSFASSSSSTSTANADVAVALDSSDFDSVVVARVHDDGRYGDDDHNNYGGRGASIITRDPRNGAFTFQVHAEYDLLLRVRGDLDRRRSRPNSFSAGGEEEEEYDSIRLSNRIMLSIDDYCMREQWMYHIGREKGLALSRFLRSCLEEWQEAADRDRVAGGEEPRKKFVCVELGTYCGYSALVLAVALRRFLLDRRKHPRRLGGGQSSSTPFEFQVYTTEVSTKVLNVARSIFRLAGMEDCITPILLQEQERHDDDREIRGGDVVDRDDGRDERDLRQVGKQVVGADESSPSSHSSSYSQSLSGVLRGQYSITKIDFLFLDHAKHLYLRDLKNLERSMLIGKGSHVCADNVVFNRLDAYREHMHRLEHTGGGVVETRLEEMNLEYSNNLKDGMEMTVYLKDPPVSPHNGDW
ncbi:hypothetical protein ACHAXA_004280 [Cyclostephanos tholiformis]|uniref:Catechol O-methyltransferase n=1 Tax=Cyclostephanos tholiformis TaxID=382380 RepID=A0ABD3SGB0_9STRA